MWADHVNSHAYVTDASFFLNLFTFLAGHHDATTSIPTMVALVQDNQFSKQQHLQSCAVASLSRDAGSVLSEVGVGGSNSTECFSATTERLAR